MTPRARIERIRRLALIARDAEALYRPLRFRVGSGSLLYMEHIEPARDSR